MKESPNFLQIEKKISTAKKFHFCHSEPNRHHLLDSFGWHGIYTRIPKM